jgi:chemotaxis protein methyltransferase CheR
MTASLATDPGDAGLVALLAQIRARTGLIFPEGRIAMCEPSIRRAIGGGSTLDLTRLAGALPHDDRLFSTLVDALTVGETYFFRDPRQLAFLRDHAIPDILRRRPAEHVLDAWSAGCSSGEEPYSLAILCDELGLGSRRRILGTDVSRSRLAAARTANYGPWSLRGVAPEVIQRYFHCSQRRFVPTPAIREGVRFEYANLAEEIDDASVGRNLDLIICRNVLIYLDTETVERAARSLVDRLADGGWLVLGSSDPPLPDTSACEVVITDAGLAYRRGRTTQGFPLRVTPRTAPVAPPASEPIAPATSDVWPPLDGVGDTAPRSQEPVPPAADSTPHAVRAEDESACVARVRTLSDGGRANEAAVCCSAALEVHPLSAELLVLQALIHMELGQSEAAHASAKRALFLDRSLVVAHLASASALIRMGDPRGARRALVNALRLLASNAPQAPVPASGGEPSARLARLARSQLRALDEVAT